MTKEEILNTVKMIDVLADRGIKVNRSGMCSCPFHGKDNHPSMKVFKDGFKCFTCNENGNVIDFVMKYDNVPFKTAYLSLGGTYETTSEADRKKAERARERARKERTHKERAEKQFKKLVADTISMTRIAMNLIEPCSDDWCFLMNKYPMLLQIWWCKYEEQEEVDEIDAIRVCREVRQVIYSICGIAGRVI